MAAVLGLIIGVVIGVFVRPDIPIALQPYLPIMVLAALDALLGAARAYFQRSFSDKVFVISFFSNVITATLLVFLGNQLGVGSQLLTAVIVVLGIRIFAGHRRFQRNRFASAHLRIDTGFFEIIVQTFLRFLAHRIGKRTGIADRLDAIGALHGIDADKDRRPCRSYGSLHTETIPVNGDRLRTGLPKQRDKHLQIGIRDHTDLASVFPWQ